MEEYFPFLQPDMYAEELETENELPLYRDVLWDVEGGTPVFCNGTPVLVEGEEAIKGWIWRQLSTVRHHHEIYTDGYGVELDTLIGRDFSRDLIIAEARRYVEECLLANPYIIEITDLDVDFLEDRLTITCAPRTIYGEVELSV